MDNSVEIIGRFLDANSKEFVFERYVQLFNEHPILLSKNFCIESFILDNFEIGLVKYTDIVLRSCTTLENVINIVGSGDAALTRKNGVYIIFYNDTKPYNRVRFSLAHELAHYILEHSGHNKKFESEADVFARNLLCNAYSVSILLKDCRTEIAMIEYISNYFKVSTAVAEIRLDELSHDFNLTSQITYSNQLIEFVSISSEKFILENYKRSLYLQESKNRPTLKKPEFYHYMQVIKK